MQVWCRVCSGLGFQTHRDGPGKVHPALWLLCPARSCSPGIMSAVSWAAVVTPTSCGAAVITPTSCGAPWSLPRHVGPCGHSHVTWGLPRACGLRLPISQILGSICGVPMAASEAASSTLTSRPVCTSWVVCFLGSCVLPRRGGIADSMELCGG